MITVVFAIRLCCSQECPGGYCVRLHLCINETIVTEEEFEIDIRNRIGSDPIEVRYVEYS